MIHTTLETMRASIRRYDLLAHPFYQAWSSGTLPVSALATYARDYGAFIRILGDGWKTLGQPEAAAIERHHAELWDNFAHALDTTVGREAELDSVRALCAEATRSFVTPAAAAGALYAFELQQPATAHSKLEGLKTHYAQLPQGIRPYFEAHANETGEDAIIEQKLAGMTDSERLLAAESCERMARALWDALTGIHSDCAQLSN